MVSGATIEERIQFKESTVWAGEPHDYSRAGAVEALDSLRALPFASKQKEADALASARAMRLALGQMPYQDLRTRVGFIVDEAWNGGMLTSAMIVAPRTGSVIVRLGDRIWQFTMKAGERRNIAP